MINLDLDGTNIKQLDKTRQGRLGHSMKLSIYCSGTVKSSRRILETSFLYLEELADLVDEDITLGPH